MSSEDETKMGETDAGVLTSEKEKFEDKKTSRVSKKPFSKIGTYQQTIISS